MGHPLHPVPGDGEGHGGLLQLGPHVQVTTAVRFFRQVDSGSDVLDLSEKERFTFYIFLE